MSLANTVNSVPAMAMRVVVELQPVPRKAVRRPNCGMHKRMMLETTDETSSVTPIHRAVSASGSK